MPEQPASAAPIRVAVVDDHPVFRLGMAGLLGSLDGISVVAQASDAQQALAIAPGSVDVVLMDLHLGEDSGIETTREIVRRDPGARVLVVTMREDDDAVASCMRVGARGYLLKGAGPDEVERAVRAVANGDVILGSAVAARAVAAGMLEVVDGYSADELKSMGTDDANADFTSADPDLAGRSDAFAEFVEQLQACTDA